MSWHFLRMYLIILCDIIVSLLVLCLWLLVPLIANLCLCQMYIAKYLLLRKGFSYCSSFFLFYLFLVFQNCKKPKILFVLLDQNVCFTFRLYALIMSIRWSCVLKNLIMYTYEVNIQLVYLKYSFHVELHLIFL